MRIFAPWFSALFAVISVMSAVKAASVRHDPTLMHRWVVVAVGMAVLALLWWVQERAVEAHAPGHGDVRSAARVALGWIVMLVVAIGMIALALRHP